MSDLAGLASSLLASVHPVALAVLFVLVFTGSVLFVPWAVVQIPADYFKSSTRRTPLWCHYPAWLRLLLMLAKNLLGLLLLLIGVALLFLPGQGLLTIVIGLLMLDVPGKFRFERWLISHKLVLQPVNWLRTRRNKPVLLLD